MKRRTFLGMVAGLLGLPRCVEPVRLIRSKPFIEMGRPEYEEPLLCERCGGLATEFVVDVYVRTNWETGGRERSPTEIVHRYCGAHACEPNEIEITQLY